MLLLQWKSTVYLPCIVGYTINSDKIPTSKNINFSYFGFLKTTFTWVLKVLLATWFGDQIHETLVLQNLVSSWITNKPGRELVRYRSHVKGSCSSDSVESVEGEEGIRPFLWRKSWSIASVLEMKLVLYKEIFPWKILNPSG